MDDDAPHDEAHGHAPDPLEALEETKTPGHGFAIAMIVTGVLFLAPFILLAADWAFSPARFISALLTVGWGVFIGVALVYAGVRRLRRSEE